MTTEVPLPPKSLTTDGERDAFRDGWTAATNNSPEHVRPNYQTHQEREAFSLGWESGIFLICFDHGLFAYFAALGP